MLDVVIACSITTPNDRYKYLVDMMDPEEFSIEFITSKFVHRSKRHRDLTIKQPEDFRCKVTYLDDPGYQKNVSFKRLYSNYILGRNLYHYLDGRKRPDIIFAACPALEIGYNAARFARKNSIPFVLDLRDIWPEAFKMLFNPPLVSDLIYWPFTKRVNYLYSNADAIVAVSDTFLERAKLNSKPGIPLERVVLGCDLSLFDHYALENNVERTDKEIWIGYIGTLGHSYDIKNTINALRILQNAGHKNLRFIVMGSGPFEEAFRRYANESGIPNEFTGSLPYPRMVGKLVACDVVVNPIVKGSAGSLINKVSDYAASGLPVLNTQECPEYRVLVERYRCGLNCKCEDPSDMAAKLNVLLNDPALRKKMGENHRRLAAEVFDRAVSYGRLIEIFRRFRKDAKG